jgi:hypothetical protein
VSIDGRLLPDMSLSDHNPFLDAGQEAMIVTEALDAALSRL